MFCSSTWEHNRIKKEIAKGKIFVPVEDRVELLRMNHDHVCAGHLGVEKTFQRLSKQYIWPRMYGDVLKYVRSCIVCAKRKAMGSSKAPLMSIPLETVAWNLIAMDIVGPLPDSSKNNKYILVICDYATRYSLAFAMADQRAVTIAKILVYQVCEVRCANETVIRSRCEFCV